jgi:DNA-binding CsgD family transcriptional regulator
MVAPLAEEAGEPFGSSPANAIATIFITDPTSQSTLPPAVQIAARFGLTATEAEVARLAAMGRGMPFVAEAMGVSINTARTHLKSVYEKSGVNHQAGLARLMAQSFPPLH